MEERVLKIIPLKSGTGAVTYRISMPKSWCDKMGIDLDNREMLCKFDGNSINITKNKKSK